jgi:hypothetical protein
MNLPYARLTAEEFREAFEYVTLEEYEAAKNVRVQHPDFFRFNPPTPVSREDVFPV